MLTLEETRLRFPYLDSGHTYLNHAATSPWSTSVSAMIDRFRQGRMLGDIDIYPDTMQVIGEVRTLAARFVGAEPSRLTFTQNTSEGLNLLASGLDWKPGDEIVLVEREFPANVWPFLALRRHGVRILFAPQRNGRVEIEDIADLMSPRTRLVSVSWVQFLSGFRINLKELSALCRTRGVLLCVDGIQGLGATGLNLAETPVDFFSAGVQKWQMGPQGLALVYVSKEVQDLITPSHVGWLSAEVPFDFFNYEQPLHGDARRFETGTYNSIGMFMYHGALSLFFETGLEEVHQRVRALATHAFTLAKECGLALLTPENEEERAGIVTFAVPDADALVHRLQERRITVSARSGYLRLSPHFYNTREEVEHVLREIRSLVSP